MTFRVLSFEKTGFSKKITFGAFGFGSQNASKNVFFEKSVVFDRQYLKSRPMKDFNSSIKNTNKLETNPKTVCACPTWVVHHDFFHKTKTRSNWRNQNADPENTRIPYFQYRKSQILFFRFSQPNRLPQHPTLQNQPKRSLNSQNKRFSKRGNC